jgi:hypothetical protein
MTEPLEDVSPVATEQDRDADIDWRQRYVREVEQSRKYRRRAQQAEETAEQLRRQTCEPDELESLKKTAAQVETIDAEKQRLTGMLEKLSGRDAMIRALVRCGVGQGFRNGASMIDQAVALLGDRVRVDLEGDEPRVQIKSDQTDRDPTDLHSFVADWLAREAPHFLPPSQDTGSGAFRGTGRTQQASLAELDADPAAKAKFIAENGPGAYVQLARQSH